MKDNQQSLAALTESTVRPLTDHASGLGNTIKNFSELLQNRSVNELMGDLREAARRNPAAFIVGGVILGIGISRLLRSSR